MDDFRNNGKKKKRKKKKRKKKKEKKRKKKEKEFKRAFLGNYQMNYSTESDMYVDIVLIVGMFCAEIFFFLGWCEKIVKEMPKEV